MIVVVKLTILLSLSHHALHFFVSGFHALGMRATLSEFAVLLLHFGGVSSIRTAKLTAVC